MCAAEQMQRIRMVALDVDGVLTNGAITLDDEAVESKSFYVRDGLGMRLLMEAGIRVGWITARRSRVVSRRAEELSLSFVSQGIKEKWPCLQEEMALSGLEASQCAYMGDDLIDLPVLTRVGLSAAPADAAPELLQRVDWVSAHPGGRGAVRELAEKILKGQGVWDGIVRRLSAP